MNNGNKQIWDLKDLKDTQPQSGTTRMFSNNDALDVFVDEQGGRNCLDMEEEDPNRKVAP